MNKTVRSVKNSLKYKAESKTGIVSVRLGGRRFTVPVEARVLKGEGYLFLSIPATSEIYELREGELCPMDPEASAESVFEALNPSKTPSRRGEHKRTLPSQVLEALKFVPPEFKIGYDSDGKPKLVRKRRRSR